MNVDDKKRTKDGVVACLRVEDKEARLIFDDVESDETTNPISWSYRAFFTWNTYELEKVLKSDLTDEQYQEIGFNLMARLGAIHKTSK